MSFDEIMKVVVFAGWLVILSFLMRCVLRR